MILSGIQWTQWKHGPVLLNVIERNGTQWTMCLKLTVIRSGVQFPLTPHASKQALKPSASYCPMICALLVKHQASRIIRLLLKHCKLTL